MIRLLLLESALEAEPDDAGARRIVDRSLKALERIGGESGPYTRLGRALILLDQASRANGSERDERLEEVEPLIESTLIQLPDERFPYILQGRLLELRARPEEAVASFEKALTLEGGNVVEPRLRALYARLGRESELRRLQHRDRRSPNLDRFAAEASARTGQTERAERLARRVVEGDPESLDARVWQARLLSSLGKPEEAEATLRALIARQPDKLGPRFALLYFLVGREQDAEARATVARILEEVPGLDRPEFVHAQCWRIVGDREQADAAYRAALEKWPEDDHVIRGAGDYFQATGRDREAERIFRDALKRDPARRWVARTLALLLASRAGDAEARRQALELVAPIADRPETPEDRFVRALVLSRGREVAEIREAVKLLDRLQADLPADLPAAARSRALLARLHLRLGEPKEAARVAAQDAGMGGSPEAIRLHVETLLAAGELDAAGLQLDRLPADDPATPLLRARWQVARKRPAEAARVLEAAFPTLAETPEGEAFGREAVRLLLEIGRDAEAERLAIEMARRWPRTAVVRAVVVAQRGRPAEALDRFEAAVSDADPAGLREMARNLLTLARIGQRDPAVVKRIDALFATIVKRQPDDPELLTRLAYLRHLQGRFRDEVQLYQQAFRLEPADASFLNNLAWTLSEELKSPREALPWIEEAIRRAGSPASAASLLDTRGVISTRLRRFPEAIADLEAAARTSPAPEVFAHLARAYYQAGQQARFLEARDKARKAGLTLEHLQPGERLRPRPLAARSRSPRRSPSRLLTEDQPWPRPDLSPLAVHLVEIYICTTP